MSLIGLEFLDWLARIAGLSGLAEWWDRWRNRPRIAVRVLGERSDQRVAEVELEVENRSDQLNSLRPEIYFEGLTPKKERMAYQFELSPNESRQLQPFRPRVVRARAKDPESKFVFLWLRKYRVPATQGSEEEVRLRWVEGPTLGLARYWLERALFRLGGRYYMRLVRDDLDKLAEEPIGEPDLWSRE